jgi:hypothetical protein
MNQTDKNEVAQASKNDIFLKLIFIIKYLKSKWIFILTTSIICALLGLAYSIFKKPVYNAECTFVLEDSGKGNSFGQYSSLASLAGINVGGGGIFEGDNIIELYKSRTMLEKALLSEVNIEGKEQTLIERYVSFNKLRDNWKKNDHISSINFEGDPNHFNRKQDSIITDIVDFFNKKLLNVDKLDKKLSIICVQFSSKDELFAKEFTNKLVERVNEFYVQTKTKKAYQNVQILQYQIDSIKSILNSSINGVASANDSNPNANPLISVLRTTSQKKQVDVQASLAIYSEIAKNLELSKISLRQETPLIQVIDRPILPLNKVQLKKFTGLLIGGVLGVLLAISYLAARFFFKEIYKLFKISDNYKWS